MYKKIFGIKKNVFILGLVSFFNDFSSEMVLSVFPAFFTSVLKTGAAALGIVEGISDFASNIIKIYSGRLSDKTQKRRKLIIFGYVLSTFTRPFYALISTATGALGLRLIDRAGKGLRDAPRDALISLSTDKKELGRAFGYHRAMDTLGGILGPLMAFFILREIPLGFNTVFLWAFVIGLVTIATLFFVKEVRLSLPGNGWPTAKNPLSERFKKYLLSVFLFSVGTLPIAVLLLKAPSAGLKLATIPLFYALTNITYSLSSWWAGHTADKRGHRKTLLYGYGCLLLSYLALFFVDGPGAIALGFLLYGLFSGLTDGIHRSYAGKITEEIGRGRTYGWLNGINGLGLLIAGLGGGILWQLWGSAAALIFGALFVLAGLIVFLSTQFKNS